MSAKTVSTKFRCQEDFDKVIIIWAFEHKKGLKLYSNRNFDTGVFLYILWNFSEQLFCRTPRSTHYICAMGNSRAIATVEAYLIDTDDIVKIT